MNTAIQTVEFLTEGEIAELMAIRRASAQYFRVGDIARLAMRRVEQQRLNIHKFLVLSAIGEISGINARRVEKFRMMAEAFPQEKREKYLQADIPFTYFESAFDFSDTGESEKFLEFVSFWLEEKGKWPGVENAGLLFRTHALGLDVSPVEAVHNASQAKSISVIDHLPPEPESPSMYCQEPAVISPQIFIPKAKLVALVDRWKEKEGDAQTVAACIEELEALL